MKRLLVFVLLLALLTACGESKPPFIDNGNPGQIKAIVFYDDNKNGVMDSGETAPKLRRGFHKMFPALPAAWTKLQLSIRMQTALQCSRI